jgi:hypothetical protein
MALSLIGVGTTANDGTGDPLRTAFQTVNTALTAVNNAVVVGTGTTTFKDDSGTYGIAVGSNRDVTFTNAGGTTGAKWDASAYGNAGGFGIGVDAPTAPLHIYGDFHFSGSLAIENTSESDQTLTFRSGTDGHDGANIGLYGGTHASLAGNIYISSGGGASTGDVIFRNTDGSSFTTLMTLQNDGVLRLHVQSTPASAGASGAPGSIVHDNNYIYVCVSSNTWKRAALSTW